MRFPSGFIHVAAAVGFAGFVLLAAVAARRGRAGGRASRGRVSLLLGWVVLVSFGAGFGQRNLYPFTHWQLLALPITPVWSYPLILGVDSAGVEHRVDYRAYDPQSFAELMAFMRRTFPALDSAGRDEVSAYLLGLVGAARERVRAGRDIRPTGRWFGPLRAPYFDLSPARWDEAADLPPPLVRLRYYQQTWEIERRRGPFDTTGVTRTLFYEGPAR